MSAEILKLAEFLKAKALRDTDDMTETDIEMLGVTIDQIAATLIALRSISESMQRIAVALERVS